MNWRKGLLDVAQKKLAEYSNRGQDYLTNSVNRK